MHYINEISSLRHENECVCVCVAVGGWLVGCICALREDREAKTRVKFSTLGLTKAILSYIILFYNNLSKFHYEEKVATESYLFSYRTDWFGLCKWEHYKHYKYNVCRLCLLTFS